jgi:hypothetical protein
MTSSTLNKPLDPVISKSCSKLHHSAFGFIGCLVCLLGRYSQLRNRSTIDLVMFSNTEKKLHLEAVAKTYFKSKAEKERKGQKMHGLITEVAQEYIGRGFDFVSRKKLY